MATPDRYVIPVQVGRPSLANNTADAERFKQALCQALGQDRCAASQVRLTLTVLKDLPQTLRLADYHVKVILFRDREVWTVAGIRPFTHARPLTGAAMDIGTTRVVLQLIDLETGQPMGQELGFDNPQGSVAPDVLARIHHAGSGSGLTELQSLIIEAVNHHIESLCTAHNLSPDDVYLVAGAGNTTMTHLFLGIDPFEIIREPYIPCVNILDALAARDLGLRIHEAGQVFLFPNIGSYFGGDLLAGILFAGLDQKEDPCILVDVGTNAEIVIGNRDWLVACAGAAGPALEGGVSKMGMTAGPGVIDRVRIDPETRRFDLHTIDDSAPIGICGSGMIDLAAQLFLSGMIDIRGKFSVKTCQGRLRDIDGIPTLTLVDKADSGTGEDILFSQVDLNSLTSSKAAMYTILEVIVRQTAGIEFQDLSTFYVAGTFGSFINPVSAISIGMLPDIALGTFEVLGNSSLKGAALMLSNMDAYDRVLSIREGITYIELNVNQAFMNMFSGAKFYPHTDVSRFPSVVVPKQ
ncbi:MAG: DUF4445 domain-containing protein [Desulfobacteraceae bacterium]|nr:MAG: DUF4445 domain-containing protein [Desulfobacteraceae bacterium]